MPYFYQHSEGSIFEGVERMTALDKIMKADKTSVEVVLSKYAQRTDDFSVMVTTVCRARLFALEAAR